MAIYNFQKYQQHHVYLRLMLFVKQYWFAFAIGLFGAVLGSATNAFFTWMLKPILDKGFINRDTHFIHWLPLMILGAFFVRNVAGYLGDFFMAWAGRMVVL